MASPDFAFYVSNSLSEATRKERRNLLIISTASLLVSTAGMAPKKISFLGIDLSEPDQRQLQYIICFAIIYFFLAFLFYGVSDLLIWTKQRNEYKSAVHSEPDDWELDQRHDCQLDLAYKMAPYVATLRTIFDFIFPLLFAMFSISSIIFRG